MIVVDVNVLAYLLIPGKFTASAERLFEADPGWAAPRLWRSELRNILANYLRVQQMNLTDAALIFQRASELIGDEEYEVETSEVLRLSRDSQCSAYDCEYVALAAHLDLPMVTADGRLARAFPDRVQLLAAG
ncbi:MAG: type II toxin-antitoxin system VapC family toxin [Xanthomonadales bacterium]|jgi:predicted nucleic acid-binding protein|nr:type II toxin-antitoxin system VapC family toxin [Xanthomonadales bacterium]